MEVIGNDFGSQAQRKQGVTSVEKFQRVAGFRGDNPPTNLCAKLKECIDEIESADRVEPLFYLWRKLS